MKRIDTSGLCLPEICDYLPDFVFLLSPELKVLWANLSFCRRMGFSPAEIKGKYCFQILHGLPEPPPGCPALRVLKTGEPAENVMRAECLGMELLVKVNPIKEGSTVKAIWHVGIVSKQLVETAKALFRAQRQEIMGRLSIGVVHDLKNFLTFMNGQLEMLRLTVNEPRVHRRLQKMQKVVEQMTLLSERLCSMAQPVPPKTRFVLVSEALNNLNPLLKALIPSRISWSQRIDLKPCYIPLEPLVFEQIILNLILNAVEAIAGEGEIRLFCKFLESTSEVQILIEDTGAGLPQNLKDHIFRPFFTTKGSGTGLGLSMVKYYVEEAGGRIRVQSQKGKGTTFELTFPTVTEPFPSL